MSSGLRPGGSELAKLLASGAVDAAVLDLDQSLVRSSGVHKEVILRSLETCGAPRTERLSDRYDACRGKAYTDILREMHQEAFGHGSGLARFRHVLQEKLDTFHPRDYPEIVIEPIPYAADILDLLQEFSTPSFICTGSIGPMANMLLRESSLESRAKRAKLVCCGDLPYDKHATEYWDTVLAGIDRSRVIGFEDHPHGTGWLLEVARLGKVFVRPSRPIDEFSDLQKRAGGRCVLVSEWLALTSPLAN